MRDMLARRAYLARLARAKQAHRNVRICSYALMSSHVHHSVLGGESPLGPFLHHVNGSFGAWTNRREDGLGPVFAERPYSKVIRSAEVLGLTVAYHHNNPPRAGLVQCPSESRWTSHRAFLGLDEAPRWLDVEWTLAEIGFSSTPSGRLSFHDFVCSRSMMPRDPLLAGPGRSSVELAQKLLLAAREHFAHEAVARPGRDPHGCHYRRVLVRTGIDVFGCQQRHIATALGLSRGMMSRLHREARVVAEEECRELVDTYLMREAEFRKNKEILLEAG